MSSPVSMVATTATLVARSASRTTAARESSNRVRGREPVGATALSAGCSDRTGSSDRCTAGRRAGGTTAAGPTVVRFRR
jgi:hypothetical protein